MIIKDMADNTVKYTINVDGNAESKLEAIGQKAGGLMGKMHGVSGLMGKLGLGAIAFKGIADVASMAVDHIGDFVEANRAQQEAEAKLGQVMRNTMGATEGEIQSIKELATAQQQLGVVGDEVQLAGAQELGTYLEKTESLKRLMPVMNDMLAQQYGLNASQEQAVTIGSMMGKVMEGQVGALSRYGYKFDEAQEKILKYGTEEEKVATLAEVIGQSVGGMNEALAATPEGKMQQLTNRLGDLKEQVGKGLVDIGTALMPLLEGAMTIAEKAMPVIADMLSPITAAIGAISGQTGAWRGYLQPIGDIFTKTVAPTVKAILGTVTGIVSRFVEFVRQSQLLQDLFKLISKMAQALGNSIKQIFSDIAGYYNRVIFPILQKIENAYRWLKGLVTGKKVAPMQGSVQQSVGVQEQVTGAVGVGSSTPMGGISAGGGAAAGKATTAVATGGTRSTHITINLGKMVENIVFDGSVGDNAHALEEQVTEILLRTLYAAEAAAV